MKKTAYLITVVFDGYPSSYYLFHVKKEAFRKIRLLFSDPLVDYIAFDKLYMEVEK